MCLCVCVCACEHACVFEIDNQIFSSYFVFTSKICALS